MRKKREAHALFTDGTVLDIEFGVLRLSHTGRNGTWYEWVAVYEGIDDRIFLIRDHRRFLYPVIIGEVPRKAGTVV